MQAIADPTNTELMQRLHEALVALGKAEILALPPVPSAKGETVHQKDLVSPAGTFDRTALPPPISANGNRK